MAIYKNGSVDLVVGHHTRGHTRFSVRTGHPHTLTPGDTTTLKRRQGARAPGHLYAQASTPGFVYGTHSKTLLDKDTENVFARSFLTVTIRRDVIPDASIGA